MLLIDFGRRNLGNDGRVTLDRITDDIFGYNGSVIFPDGKYILNHQKVQGSEEDREYYLAKYVVLSKAVAGDEETLKRIFNAMFIRHTDYGPEDVHPDDPYGYNPFAIAREAGERVNSAKKEKDKSLLGVYPTNQLRQFSDHITCSLRLRTARYESEIFTTLQKRFDFFSHDRIHFFNTEFLMHLGTS